MKNFFQQKYILRATALAVLALVSINIFLPKINEYNENVYEEQTRLKIEANGKNDEKAVSFGLYSFETNRSGILIIILTAVFLSLLITKRLTLSFIFAFLLVVQLIVFSLMQRSLKTVPFYYSDYFDFFFFTIWFTLSFWEASAICRFCHRKFQREVFLK